ncbi:bHLH transcription factor Myc [Temnothorax americanus]|uniref:bHLH transcription factor Myc n=1 Tax=Temnothorax americanus TaxID=1964332 RepID=UPI00406928BA
MVQMETKMLMPSVPAAMAKLHQRNDAFGKFRNVNSVKNQIDILEYIAQISPKIKEREDMLKAVQLIDFVPQFTQSRFQRVTYPFAKKDPWNNGTTIANEEKKAKIQLPSLFHQWPVQEPQVVQEPKSKSKPEPEPEPEPKPELKLNSESEAELKSKSEIETEMNPEPRVKYYSEQELEDLGVQEWQQSLRLASNPEWEEELRKLLRQWATYPDHETMTTRDWLNRLFGVETEEDLITQLKMNDPVTKSEVNKFKRLTKDNPVNQYFITCENSNRMLSETVKYENVSPRNQNKNVQQCQPKTQIACRSLLRCQQNVNNTNSGAMNIPHQLPSTSANLSQSSSTSGQLSSTSGQFSSTRILRSSGQPVLTSHLNCHENVVTTYNQQVNRQEENQDDVEMIQELNLHKQATQIDDTNEEPTFRHQMNVSEYINIGLTGSSPSLNNEEQSSTSQSQRAIAIGRRRRRKTEENQRQNDIKNTLIDHCYHLNEPEGAERLEMKESDEEEIDVGEESVEYQATCFNSARTQHGKAAVTKASDTFVCRRPRGRPPGRNYGKRKRDAEDDQVDRPAPKRSRVKSNRRTVRHRNNIQQNQNESDESDETKRRNHNCLERQRRADLRKVYDDLRKTIPAVASNPKAAKVDILKYGRAYVIELRRMEEIFDREVAKRKRLTHKRMVLVKMKIELEQKRKKLKITMH